MLGEPGVDRRAEGRLRVSSRHLPGKRSAANDAKKAFSAALDALGLLRKTGRSATPPRINLERLAASSLQAGKHPLSGR